MKQPRKATRAETVEKVARELALQAGQPEAVWSLQTDAARKLCILRPGEARELVRSYETRRRQGATAQ